MLEHTENTILSTPHSAKLWSSRLRFCDWLDEQMPLVVRPLILCKKIEASFLCTGAALSLCEEKWCLRGRKLRFSVMWVQQILLVGKV